MPTAKRTVRAPEGTQPQGRPRPARSGRPRGVSEDSAEVMPDIKEYESAMTVEVKDKGVSMWVKVGATAQLRPGESATTMSRRLSAWVEKRAEEKVREMLA